MKRRLSSYYGIGCLAVGAVLLVGLAIAGTVWGPRLLDRFSGQTAAVPLGIEDRTSPEQLAAHREQATAQLNAYGWVNREAGVVHIPIEQAMTLLAEQGLPVGLEDGQEESAPAVAPVDPASVGFQDDVLPIFMEHCSECHGDDNPEEGLELTSYDKVMAGSIYGAVVIPGDVDNSYLAEMVVSGKMPKRGDDLSPTQIGTILAWIEAGAPDN